MASLKDSKISISAMPPDIAMNLIMDIRNRRRTFSARQEKKKTTSKVSKTISKLGIDDLKAILEQLEA